MLKADHKPTLKVIAGFWSLTAIVAAGWITDGLNGDCLWQWWLGACGPDPDAPSLLRVLLAGLIFVAALVQIYRVAQRFVPVRHLARSEVRPHTALIAALSPFAATVAERNGALVVADAKGEDKQVTLSGDIDKDIESFDQAGWRWPGQQFLRALRPHVQAGRLRYLALIGSAGKHGSQSSLNDAKRLALHYGPQLEVWADDQAVDFENVEAVQTRFDTWVRHFIAAGISEDEIILDATGGTKTTSIAAALTTLHRPRIQFQYVQTQPQQTDNQYHVLAFNVVAESLPREGGL